MDPYRLFLRMFPPAFRARFENDLIEVFADRLAAARRHGRASVAVCWIRTVADLTRHGVAERLAAWRTNQR